MVGCCHHDTCSSSKAQNNRQWRRALWIALGINAGMFLAEIGAGVAAGSASLQADAIDFLGDAANYMISLSVVGMAITWRARAALLKGWSLALLATEVLASTAWHTYAGTLPGAKTMSIVGVVALFANGGIALMLYRFRAGEANMRSVWICSRNDAIGNLAVLGAAAGVFGAGAAGPDLVVAGIMAVLGMSGGWQIIRQASSELSGSRLTPADAAR
jgi:Co/Zn/Cd efflux system component